MELPPILFENVTVKFEDRDVLKDVCLTLSEQRIGIIGANGTGKSTLSRLINGLVLPTHGTVHVGNLNTHIDEPCVTCLVRSAMSPPHSGTAPP